MKRPHLPEVLAAEAAAETPGQVLGQPLNQTLAVPARALPPCSNSTMRRPISQ
jgi:hypothetical protein